MLAAGNRAEHRLSFHCETAKDIVTAAIVKEARSGEQILPASRAARHHVSAGRQIIGSLPKIAYREADTSRSPYLARDPKAIFKAC